MSSDDLAREILRPVHSARELARRPPWRTGIVKAIDERAHIVTVTIDGKDTDVPASAAFVRRIGDTVIIPMNGDAPSVVMPPSAGISLQSTTVPYQSGVSGWGIFEDGTAEFNDVLMRGRLLGLGGPQLLPNGTGDQDTTGWAASIGSLAQETTPAQIRTGPGALQHTLTSGLEGHLRTPESGSGLFTIDPTMPHRLLAYVKPGAVGDKARVGIRWYDAAGTWLAETFTPYLTGITTYGLLYLYAEPPFSTQGQTIYYPAADILVENLSGSPINTAGNRYQNLDESAVNTNDFVYTSAGLGGRYLGSCSITAGALAGKTIRSLKVSYWLNFFANADVNYVFQPILRIGGVDRAGTAVGIYALAPGAQRLDMVWDKNPATGQAWTAADIEAFRVGGPSSFGGLLLSNDVPTNNAQLLKMEFVPLWSSTSAPAKASARLYGLPASGAGSTFRWDDVLLQEASSVDVGRVTTDRIGNANARRTVKVFGNFEPFDMGEFALATTVVGPSFIPIGSPVTVWDPPVEERRPVTVRITARGVAIWVDFADPQELAARASVSFDGGATWQYGAAIQVGVEANYDRLLSCGAVKTGTPTGPVLVRVEAGVSAGYHTNTTMQYWSAEGEIMPAAG